MNKKNNTREKTELNAIFERLNTESKKELLYYAEFLASKPGNVKQDTHIIPIPTEYLKKKSD